MIPTPEEIRLFTNIVRESLTRIDKGHFNCRPLLFIGNVGTHHSTIIILLIQVSLTIG